MKIYTQVIDIALQSPKRFWVAPYSDFKIGVKIVRKGTPVANEFTVKQGSTTLTADETKVDGFTTYTLKSGTTGAIEYVVEVAGVAEKQKITQIVTDSTVFDVGGEGGGGVTEEWVQEYVSAQTSAFVTDTELGTVLEAYPTTSEMNSAISTATSDKVTGTGVGQAPAVRAITTVYDTAWATLSGNADPNTFYVVIPEPVFPTRVKYTTASGYPDWEDDIVGPIMGGDGSPTEQIPHVDSASEIVIGSNVTSVGDYAFYYCTNISSVTFQNGLSSIGYGAFQYCSGLTSVTIPGSVTEVANGAFEECTSLTSVTVEDGVTWLGDYSFENCSSLSSFTMTSSVTTLGDDIFRGCTNLMSVTWQGMTMAQVQGRDLSYCGFQTGCVIHCTDGDITIS